jgi:hypothetical protein
MLQTRATLQICATVCSSIPCKNMTTGGTLSKCVFLSKVENLSVRWVGVFELCVFNSRDLSALDINALVFGRSAPGAVE